MEGTGVLDPENNRPQQPISLEISQRDYGHSLGQAGSPGSYVEEGTASLLCNSDVMFSWAGLPSAGHADLSLFGH